jgi:hypothetical protein
MSTSLQQVAEFHPDDDLADLRRSGLSDDTISSMNCTSAEADIIRLHTGVEKVVQGGYSIPYPGLTDQTGQPYRRWRLRQAIDGMRYAAGVGDDPQLYMPPALAALPGASLLVVTEGEKKAAKAVQEGIHCVGVQGVWSWCDPGYRAVEKGEGDHISEETAPLSYPIPSGIAIRLDGQHLLLPAGLGVSEIAAVVGHKAEILERLRSEQTTAAGFYTQLPAALLCELRAAPWVVLDVETTGLTRYSAPARIAGSTRIGPGTWTTYRAANPGASLSTSPRIRVLTVHTEALGTCAWDLDELQPEDRLQLFGAVLDKKIVIGHNAGFDLSWLFGETSARPRFLLDSMLLVRHIRPGVLIRLFGTAAVGDEAARKRAIELIERKHGKPSASLEFVAASLRLPTPDKSYQKPANWCVSPLSVQHSAYVAGDVDLPLRILNFLMPGVGVETMPAHIEHTYPWYPPFAAATMRLAEAHVRGVPFSLQAAEQLRAQYLSKIGESVDDLVQVPEYADLRKTLLDPHSGETKEMKQAMAAHAKAHGVTLATTEAGNICTNRDAMKESGASELPASILLESITAGKKAIGTIDEFKRASSADGRLHSLITFATATGRTSSSEPNLQNVPRDVRFRELIRARPGYAILSADYAAIELRIAAALGERGIADL